MKTNHIILVVVFLIATAFTINTKTEDKIDYDSFLNEYFNHFNNHDWEAMANMYAETSKFKDPVMGVETFIKSREDIIQQYTELSQMIPDVKDSVVAIYPSGNHVTVEFLSTGTAPDGSRFILPISSILKIEEGLITQDYTYYDNF